MNMIFGVKDRPKFGQTILFAIQQLLAIMAATLVVPVITNGATGSTLSPAAALFGAGVGTLVYLLFTKFRSPVFLGSSFAFLGSMAAAFAGGVSMTLGYAGLILGAVFAGFVYVIIAAAVKVAGVKWLDRLMPVVVIGPTVSIIGLSLAGNAVSDLIKGSVVNAEGAAVASPLITVLCGLVALLVTMLCATYGQENGPPHPVHPRHPRGLRRCGGVHPHRQRHGHGRAEGARLLEAFRAVGKRRHAEDIREL